MSKPVIKVRGMKQDLDKKEKNEKEKKDRKETNTQVSGKLQKNERGHFEKSAKAEEEEEKSDEKSELVDDPDDAKSIGSEEKAVKKAGKNWKNKIECSMI